MEDHPARRCGLGRTHNEDEAVGLANGHIDCLAPVFARGNTFEHIKWLDAEPAQIACDGGRDIGISPTVG
jgi:hypothetical protein